MTFRVCKIYVRLVDGRCGIAVEESARKFVVQLGSAGPHETHWRRHCEVISEADFDDYLYGNCE